MSFPHTISNLTTREAIADAVYRATNAFDDNDFALLCTAMTSDVEFVVDGHTMKGLDTIKAQSLSLVGPMDTVHLATNLRIDVKDDTATTASLTCNFLAQHYPPGKGSDEENRRLLVSGKYFADLIKDSSDGLWKATKFVVKVIWREGDASVMQPPSS